MVDKDEAGGAGPGVDMVSEGTVYVDFLANLETFEVDPPLTRWAPPPAQSATALRAVSKASERLGGAVSLDHNIYLYRCCEHGAGGMIVGTNWYVIASDVTTSAHPYTRFYKLTCADGSPLSADADGFDRLTVAARKLTTEDFDGLAYRVYVNGMHAVSGETTDFLSLNHDASARHSVRRVAFCGQGVIDDLAITQDAPPFARARQPEGDCFLIVPGSLPHVAHARNALLDFAVDSFGAAGWRVVFHGGGHCAVAVAEKGQIVNDDLLRDERVSVEGTGEVFRFAFLYRDPHDGRDWYGWVSLGTKDGCLAILGSGISDTADVAVVGCGETEREVVRRVQLDHGTWVELDAHCLVDGAEGRVVIPETIDGKPVRAIGYQAFLGFTEITEVVIPDGVGSIGDSAFADCRALRRLAIPSSVTNVGMEIVGDCKALGDVWIGGGLPSFGYKAFAHSAMTNLVLELGVTNIDNYAFAGNRCLRSVVIPLSVERICTWSFDKNCTGLREARVPYATVVEDEAFPPGCEIVRYGLGMFIPGDLRAPDEDTKAALMRTMSWRDYATARCLAVCGDYRVGELEPQPHSAVYACAHLGISPVAFQTYEGADYVDIEALYRMPSVEFVGIDPRKCVITGRVVPAKDARIVAPPLHRAFGFSHFSDWGTEYRHEEMFGKDLALGEPGFSLDLSDYVSSNGVFRLTYPDWISGKDRDKSAPSLFRILLRDYLKELW